MRFRPVHRICIGVGLLAAAVAISGTSSAAPLTSTIIDSSGRWVAFTSDVKGLARGDDAGSFDVYVRDRSAGTTELISVIPDDLRGSYAFSFDPSMSADGRLVAFRAETNDVRSQILMRDRKTNTTELLSVGLDGAAPNMESMFPKMTPDGRYVAFKSWASNLVSADANRQADVFVLDRKTATIDLVSLSSGESQISSYVNDAIAISDDGRYVAFVTNASNVVPGDANRLPDVFVRDRVAGTTELVSVSSDEEPANGETYGFGGPQLGMSADGRYVAFESAASNLVPGDGNRANDVFVRDRLEGATERVSLSDDDRELPRAFACAGCASLGVSMSADGRLVVFSTDAPSVVPGDTNDDYDVFVRDRIARTTRRVSLTDTEGQTAGGDNRGGEISADGRFVVFSSYATNLSTRVYDRQWNVFVRDLAGGTTELIEAPTTPAEAGRVVLQPAKPNAGRRLIASISITQGGKPVVSATVACSAKINGRVVLRATSSRYRNGRARCSWMLPDHGRSQTISGSITASTPNGSVQRAFRTRVQV